MSFNSASAGGVLASFEQKRPTLLSDCTISYNSAHWGGAIHAEKGSVVNMVLCLIVSNTASYCGGAISVDNNATLQVAESIMSSNSVSWAGGAIWSRASLVFLSESDLFGNFAIGGGAVYAGTNGDGIADESCSTVLMYDVVLSLNIATMGGALYAAASSCVRSMECAFTFNYAVQVGFFTPRNLSVPTKWSFSSHPTTEWWRSRTR